MHHGNWFKMWKKSRYFEEKTVFDKNMHKEFSVSYSKSLLNPNNIISPFHYRYIVMIYDDA